MSHRGDQDPAAIPHCPAKGVSHFPPDSLSTRTPQDLANEMPTESIGFGIRCLHVLLCLITRIIARFRDVHHVYLKLAILHSQARDAEVASEQKVEARLSHRVELLEAQIKDTAEQHEHELQTLRVNLAARQEQALQMQEETENERQV